MRVALLAKRPRDPGQLREGQQLQGLQSFADLRGWPVTREYLDDACDEFIGRSAKMVFVDASANCFDAVLVVGLDGYGGLKGVSIRVVVDQLAKHRVSLICTHQEGEGSIADPRVVLRYKSKVVESHMSILRESWSLRVPSPGWRQYCLREWR